MVKKENEKENEKEKEKEVTGSLFFLPIGLSSSGVGKRIEVR